MVIPGQVMANFVQYSGPAFLVSVAFVDPGNWVTLIEGGSRFGYELAWVVFFSTLLAMLLQTISARLGVITGKNFAQVCREEFPSAVCTLLWGLCEISIITSDLTMVLGTAIGLNVILRIPVLPSLLLMTFDSFLFMLLLPLLEVKKAVVMTMAVVGIVLLCFLLDNVFSGTVPLSIGVGLLPKLRHETLYATISVIGANVMPHNFYLHSALVKDLSQTGLPLNTLLRNCFLGTTFAFGAVLLVNWAVLSVAVAALHNAGLVVLTFQDAQALIEQILNNTLCPPVFGLALLYAGQLSTYNGSSAGQIVSDALFDYKIYPWQHRFLIRGIALVPVATCAWRYGNEGTYQMLIFAQVLLALHLPFTVIPLIKITSSERIMGSHKNYFLVETSAWLFVGILSAVNVTLVFDLVFGEDHGFGGFEYLVGFEWLTEIGGENLQSVLFAVISAGTTLSLGFLIWLIFAPLKLDTQFPLRYSWIEDHVKQEESEWVRTALGTRTTGDVDLVDAGIMTSAVGSKGSDEPTFRDLPSITLSPTNSQIKTLVSTREADIKEAESSPTVKSEADPGPLHQASFKDSSLENHRLPPIPSAASRAAGENLSPVSSHEPAPTTSSETVALVTNEAAPAMEDLEATALKTAEAEADAEAEIIGKDDDEIEAWMNAEQGEVQAGSLAPSVNGSTRSVHSEGLESVKSDTGVGSEGGSGSGSLSRISGLGRAARRQFALILDEFWANLFDLHGQPLPPKSQGLPSSRANQSEGNLRGMSSSHDRNDAQKVHSKQQKSSWKKLNKGGDQVHNIDAQMLRMHSHAAASTSSPMPQTYSQEYRTSPSYVSERRYSSMHMPVYHEDYDYQPATIHGYRTPSFPGRPGLNARPLHMEVPLFGSRASPGPGYQVDTDATANGYRTAFDNTGQPLLSSQWVSNVVGSRHLIDSTGSDRFLTQPEKHLREGEASRYGSSPWDPVMIRSRDSQLGRWNPLVYRVTGELDMNNKALRMSRELNQQGSFGHSTIGRGGHEGDHVDRSPLAFDELSPSQSHRDAFSIQASSPRTEAQSLWSRQPFEQLFGATEIDNLTSPRMPGGQAVQASLSGGPPSDAVEIELEVLEKLQVCLQKLLRLEGAEWLFRTDNGADEDLITAIAATVKTGRETDKSEPHRHHGNHEHQLSENYGRAHGRRSHVNSVPSRRPQSGVPHCDSGCVWDGSLLVSFGVWCVHRILELSLMESRPELWGKYTYVLNRLQGILEPAFSKQRIVPVLCSCVNESILVDIRKRRSSISRQGSSRDHGNVDFGSLSAQSYPHPWPWGRNTSCTKGKGLSAGTFIDMIKEVEAAVGSRKGRTGTAAGDVAFPKGKENLASVLKRYKRRLSNKPPGSTGGGGGGRRV